MIRWTGIALLLCFASACRSEPAPPFHAEGSCPVPPPLPPGLWLSGSGATLALARAVAVEYERQHPGHRVHLPESIGTGGALRALKEGVLPLGLGSRPLTASERASGLREWPLARSAIVIAVPAGSPVVNLPTQTLEALVRSERARWPDGTPAVPFLREAGDSGERVIAQVFPSLGAALAEARTAGRWTVLNTEQRMRDALEVTPGSVGYLDSGVAREHGDSLQALSLDGVPPTDEAVREGRYPLVRTLTLLSQGEPIGEAKAFLAFAQSPEGQAAIAAAGYVGIGSAGGGAR